MILLQLTANTGPAECCLAVREPTMTPGTAGMGEDVCPACRGCGKLASGQPCPECGGTGKIVEGMGGRLKRV